MRFFLLGILLMTLSLPVYADKVTLLLKSGKKVKGEIVKIEVSAANGANKMETTTINAAQGVNELMLKLRDIKQISFKSADDVSCYEDSRFAPIRKTCTMKSLYYVTLKKKPKSKEKIEITDNRIFYFHLKGKKEPINFFLYKIKITNEGREKETTYSVLEQEVLKHRKDGVKKIIFNWGRPVCYRWTWKTLEKKLKNLMDL